MGSAAGAHGETQQRSAEMPEPVNLPSAAYPVFTVLVITSSFFREC